ncbi:peptidoglycan DD-metalloendopeptidase family protein [Nocardia beijingensis]|uniref:M23 family metallopeptidase n=1 Tax=Nocardia beijingensis TaxID=95162 RepID=UPI001895FC86|nr:M23 family metallopeptidase [Nocardia beijingensis]MBF6469934.1 peptidoglycan DD-metalloendopeptidase family protein [Nocardia beijingensis]
MSQHRVGPSSITVQSLLGDGGETGRPTRHRAEPSATERVKAAATAAVTAGALIGAASQVAPALAYAAPLLPGSHDADEEQQAAPATVKGTSILPVAEAKAAAEPVAQPAPEPTAVAAGIAAPVATPFGIPNLPPEIAGPLAQAEEALKGVQQQVAPAPAVRPVAGAISSGYGSRWGAMHYGLDFADALGAPIHSVSNGTVIEAGPASGFGLWVRVLQDDGTTAVYGHVNEMFVHAGQRVNAGEVIATVGNRGQSTGPHLHLEIWDQSGSKIDPLPYLAAKGVPMEWGPSAH